MVHGVPASYGTADCLSVVRKVAQELGVVVVEANVDICHSFLSIKGPNIKWSRNL